MTLRAKALALGLVALVTVAGLSAAYALACPTESPVPAPAKYGKCNVASLYLEICVVADPVNAQTGNFVEQQTDLSVNGRGPGLAISRTYNALAAVEAKSAGPWGYGWSGPYGSHLEISGESGAITVVQENGATASFALSGGKYVPGAWVQATLVKEEPEAKSSSTSSPCRRRKSSSSTPKAS
jgi:hypothetical protein